MPKCSHEYIPSKHVCSGPTKASKPGSVAVLSYKVIRLPKMPAESPKVVINKPAKLTGAYIWKLILVLGRFPAKLGPKTSLNESGSKMV